jgi:hypothetical protein
MYGGNLHLITAFFNIIGIFRSDGIPHTLVINKLHNLQSFDLGNGVALCPIPPFYGRMSTMYIFSQKIKPR